jgi:hypothetical protein
VRFDRTPVYEGGSVVQAYSKEGAMDDTEIPASHEGIVWIYVAVFGNGKNKEVDLGLMAPPPLNKLYLHIKSWHRDDPFKTLLETKEVPLTDDSLREAVRAATSSVFPPGTKVGVCFDAVRSIPLKYIMTITDELVQNGFAEFHFQSYLSWRRFQ